MVQEGIRFITDVAEAFLNQIILTPEVIAVVTSVFMVGFIAKIGQLMHERISK